MRCSSEKEDLILVSICKVELCLPPWAPLLVQWHVLDGSVRYKEAPILNILNM